MSLKTTKTHLIKLLSDPDNSVIALSGKWGTGKSHLWREVKAESKDDKVKSALYVSLFGLNSMDQVKLKIIQGAIPSIEEHPSWWEKSRKGWSAASKLLESFHKGFSALNEIALLAVPSILKDKVIVLDDIERKHTDLSVDEVMGFIDEFTQQHGARIILILNSDQLADRLLWDKLREKVIDQELSLDTSPIEAFDIAVAIAPSAYTNHIKKAIEICGISNIRIICKVIRAVNRILGDKNDLSEDVLGRVIPSTVLLSAIHYKGIEDGPDFEFVLNVGNVAGNWGKKEAELDEADKRSAKWRLRLHELGILVCDEYEKLVVDFLSSGMFDVADVAAVIERYSSEAELMKVQGLSRQLHDHVIWHYKMTEPELVAEAIILADKVNLLDHYTVTSLHDLLTGLAGGVAVADSMIDNWIAVFKLRDIQNVDFDFDDSFGRSIHPRIKAEFDAVKAAAQAKTTVFDAVKHIAQHSGWGRKQEGAMKSATVQDFEATIRSLDINDLRYFMSRFLDLCVHRATYQPHFGTAMDNFIEACRKICSDANSGRLSSLIKLLFKDAHLESELNQPPKIPSTTGAANTPPTGV